MAQSVQFALLSLSLLGPAPDKVSLALGLAQAHWILLWKREQAAVEERGGRQTQSGSRLLGAKHIHTQPARSQLEELTECRQRERERKGKGANDRKMKGTG